MSYTILIFYLLFWLPLDSVMPQHLFCVPYPTFSNLCHSIFHPSDHLFHLLSSNSLFLCSVAIFIISTSIHYSLPPHPNFKYLSFCPLWLCESFSTFSILPVHHITSRPVVYKSLWLVVISFACNCCYLTSFLVPYPFLLFSPLTIQSPCVSPACLLQN